MSFDSWNKTVIQSVSEATKENIVMPEKLFRTALCLVLFISFFACSTFSPAPTPNPADIEKEEQAVYAVFANEGKGSALILQNTSTSTLEDPQLLIDNIKESLPGISNGTIDSYLERNAQPSQLSPDMQLGLEYSLLTQTELAEISSQQNWHEILRERYPGVEGYYIFSRVGFNNSLNQAVVYVGRVAGPLMGSGSYYLLEKEDGQWIIKEETMIWIS
jgi:hypothetical protein